MLQYSGMHRSSRVHELTSRRLRHLCLLLLLGSGTALSLDSTRELSQFRHEVWLTENGLPQNTVHALAQTSDGYLWIGTEEGLARFDGIRFTVFNQQNTAQLKSNYIRTLVRRSARRALDWHG